ncbi:hypothetical protein J6590_075827 [Homalodisca vitripennis]|nr:hypothetical protein J6590_075827 [Homalodisca vitripennis]
MAPSRHHFHGTTLPRKPIEPRQFNTLVWRVHMEEALRMRRFGAFDGHLAECEELSDPDLLNAEAWEILECGVEGDTSFPYGRALRVGTGIRRFNVSANQIPNISVDLSFLVFNDENLLDILWEELQQELRSSSADPPDLVPEISPVTTTNSILTSDYLPNPKISDLHIA